jgi:hypothetical protein
VVQEYVAGDSFWIQKLLVAITAWSFHTVCKICAHIRFGEGFRMPSGVRKPPMHEPAGLRRWPMGISGFAQPLWFRNRLGFGVGGELVSEFLCQTAGRSGTGYGSYAVLPR